jgi:mannose-6-phosphate isomerase-like protein (cupin superfamily)
VSSPPTNQNRAEVFDLSLLVQQAREHADGFLWQPLASSQHFTAALVHANGSGNIAQNGPGDHIHDNHDTFDMILEGEAELEVGGKTIQLKGGNALFIPAGVPHGFRGRGAMSLLSIYMPFLDPENPGRRSV